MNRKNKDFYVYLPSEGVSSLNPKSSKTEDACFNNSLLHN